MNKDAVAEMSQQYQVEAVEKVVPEGYKQTEVGLMPEDWEVVTLGTVGEIKMCKRIFKNQTKDVAEVPFYKIGTFGREPDAFISKELFDEYRSKYSYPKKGEILISAAGTIGRAVIFDGQPSYFQDSNIIWISNDEEKVLNSYLWHYYKVVKWSTSEGGIVSRLYNDNIRNNVFIAYPATTEQKEIAAALSDTEALVSELEKLIAKKQAIKTATMQQLLTGRTRLPQFAHHPDGSKKGYKQSELGEIPEDWEAKSFGDLFESSITRKRINPSEVVSFVGMQDVSESAQLVNQSQIQYSTVKSGFTYFEKDDVLVAKITPCFENGKGCHAVNLKTDIGFGSTEFHVLRAKSLADSRFIYYWTTRESFRAELETEMVGSAGHRRVPLAALQDYLIPCPSDKQEQTAIATILADMDEEIQALEQRLNKTRQIKQGMMQELLTGKIRLVKPSNKDPEYD